MATVVEGDFEWDSAKNISAGTASLRGSRAAGDRDRIISARPAEVSEPSTRMEVLDEPGV